jgi:hypothetical protein
MARGLIRTSHFTTLYSEPGDCGRHCPKAQGDRRPSSVGTTAVSFTSMDLQMQRRGRSTLENTAFRQRETLAYRWAPHPMSSSRSRLLHDYSVPTTSSMGLRQLRRVLLFHHLWRLLCPLSSPETGAKVARRSPSTRKHRCSLVGQWTPKLTLCCHL